VKNNFFSKKNIKNIWSIQKLLLTLHSQNGNDHDGKRADDQIENLKKKSKINLVMSKILPNFATTKTGISPERTLKDLQ